MKKQRTINAKLRGVSTGKMLPVSTAHIGITSSSDSVLVLSYLILMESHLQETEQLEEDRFFPCSLKRLESVLGMGRGVQNKVFTDLQKRKIVTLSRRGMPASRFVRINHENILAQINRTYGSGCTRKVK